MARIQAVKHKKEKAAAASVNQQLGWLPEIWGCLFTTVESVDGEDAPTISLLADLTMRQGLASGAWLP